MWLNSQAKLQRAECSPFPNEEFPSTDVFHPNTSDIPPNVHCQKWDQDGKAVGYATDVISPMPLVANANTFLPLKYPHDVDEGGNSTTKSGRQESIDSDVSGWRKV